MPVFRRDDSDSFPLILWASVCLTMLRLCLEAAAWLVLWQVYGRQTVAGLHLSMVRIKPELVVSNGDVLRGFGPLHFFYGVGLWIPTTVRLPTNQQPVPVAHPSATADGTDSAAFRTTDQNTVALTSVSH